MGFAGTDESALRGRSAVLGVYQRSVRSKLYGVETFEERLDQKPACLSA